MNFLHSCMLATPSRKASCPSGILSSCLPCSSTDRGACAEEHENLRPAKIKTKKGRAEHAKIIEARSADRRDNRHRQVAEDFYAAYAAAAEVAGSDIYAEAAIDSDSEIDAAAASSSNNEKAADVAGSDIEPADTGSIVAKAAAAKPSNATAASTRKRGRRSKSSSGATPRSSYFRHAWQQKAT